MDLTVGGSNAERSSLALPTATPVEGGALPGAEGGQTSQAALGRGMRRARPSEKAAGSPNAHTKSLGVEPC